MIKLSIKATLQCDHTGCDAILTYDRGASLSHAENNITKLAKYKNWKQDEKYNWFCPQHQGI